VTSQELLGWVLREARETVNRSPEQAGEAAGVSGRTVRRLEAPDADAARPRLTTLDALASFYGLRRSFLRELGSWDLAGAALIERLREVGETHLGAATVAALAGERNELELLAMRLARGTGLSDSGSAPAWTKLFVSLEGGRQSVEAEAMSELLGTYLALDRRRRGLLCDLARELKVAAERERAERRDD